MCNLSISVEDSEQNSGPTYKYLCVRCEKPVRTNFKEIQSVTNGTTQTVFQMLNTLDYLTVMMSIMHYVVYPACPKAFHLFIQYMQYICT